VQGLDVGGTLPADEIRAAATRKQERLLRRNFVLHIRAQPLGTATLPVETWGETMPTPAPVHAVPLAALVLLLAGCSESPQKQASAPPPPTVTVAKPTKRVVVDQDEYVGRFVAIDSVEIRARVSGYLDRIDFTDGQMVKQGDLLFTVDKRPFQTTLDQAKANLAQARANLAFAESDLARGAQLVRERTITEQTFDQRTQTKRVAEAAVQAQEAAVRQASLDLEFTELRAPVAGRIGDRRVSPGNLVTGGTSGNTTMLATIVSVDPIRFEFTFDEASYLRYERLAQSGREMTSRNASVVVDLKLIDEPGFTHQGRMDFVDNVIDRSSGTIRGRAVFSNPDGVFTPGMFGRVRVPGSPSYMAVLVPDAAIGTEQTRKYVLIVDADNVVRMKYVTLGQAVDNLRVIKSGLGEDERVVVNGLMRARPNQKVTPQDETAPARPPGSPQAEAQPAKPPGVPQTKTD
jgi:RND family efflux transporter MFP subunit